MFMYVVASVVAPECMTFEFLGITFQLAVGKRVEIVSSTRSLSRLGELLFKLRGHTFIRKEVNKTTVFKVDFLWVGDKTEFK